jgi:2-methylcitrate dehydratase PrpD
MTTTADVAHYITSTGFEDLGDAAVAKAKALCLSTLGMSVAGSRLHAGQVLAEYSRKLGGEPLAGVIGCNFQTSSELAAFVNATGAHSTELEDDSWPESMYTCHIIPAVFALAQELGASGSAIIEAFAMGYEVQARPGMIVTDGGATDRGHLTAPHLGTLGVAAAGAKLLGLDHGQVVNAISLAVSQASGSTRQMGTGAHLFEAGVAARNGICAARLAQLGLSGDPHILEGPRGYFDALAGYQSLDFDLGVGDDLRIMAVGFKKFTACYLMQRIVDGVIELIEENDISASDVERVTVEVNPTFPEIIKYPEPTNEDESRFSLHHCIAAALLREPISIRTFTDEGVRDPRHQEQWPKTEMLVNPEWERAILGESNPVTIETVDGRRFDKLCVFAHGDPENPLTDAEVEDKFRGCVEGIIPDDVAEQVAKQVFELETLDNVSELMETLTFVPDQGL